MKIGICGMGLIGGSLGRAVLNNTDNEVFGFDTSEDALIKADLLRAETGRLTEDNAGELDMLIFAVCPNAAIETMRRFCPLLKAGAIVADACGNKRVIVAEMKKLSKAFPDLFFVGLHPMAGREFSGIAHSTATLFERSYVIVVPVSQDLNKLTQVKKLFESLGIQGVEVCSAQRHDEMISYTSQLAHVVSSSYVDNAKSCEHAGFSAGSFRDMTRVAKLNPDMWTELFLQNADNLTADIEQLIGRLTEFDVAIKSGNAERVKTLLQEGADKKEISENARRERLK